MHALGAERIDRERERQRRIDAAGKTEQHARKAVLVDVVADAAHEPGVDDRLRSSRLRRPANRRAREAPRRRVVLGEQQRIDELRRARRDAAVGFDEHRAAIEQEIVLTADDVDVGDRDAVLARAVREQVLARLRLRNVVTARR